MDWRGSAGRCRSASVCTLCWRVVVFNFGFEGLEIYVLVVEARLLQAEGYCSFISGGPGPASANWKRISSCPNSRLRNFLLHKAPVGLEQDFHIKADVNQAAMLNDFQTDLNQKGQNLARFHSREDERHRRPWMA